MKTSERLILGCVLFIGLVGCDRGTPGAAPTPSQAAPVTGVATSADGVSVPYESRGSGNTTLLFVHCWSCDHEFWREQVDVFDDQFQVVTLDLGGHGRAGTNRDNWKVVGLANDVVAVADALSLDRVILIGHSMGGPVSLEAARLMPDRMLGIVAVDTLHDADMEFPAEMTEQMTAAFNQDFVGTMSRMFDGMSGATMEPDLREWIIRKASAANPKIATTLIADFATLDTPKMFADAGVPIRAINAAPGPMSPETKIEGNRQYADFDAVIMNDVGHFLQLEAPMAFNEHLRAVLKALEPT